MKISVPTRKLIDIGKLDATRKLPMEGRLNSRMKTICDRCRHPIIDEYFIAGWKEGRKPMKFHEKCFSQE